MRKKEFAAVAALLLALALAAAVPVLAQVPQEEEPGPVGSKITGYITSISGTQIFVEADPSVGFSAYDPATGLRTCEEKIYPTVTGETSILRSQGGELVPASFGDLAVGQLVSATDTGVLATSCPPQGSTAGVVILDGLPDLGGGNSGFEQYDPAF